MHIKLLTFLPTYLLTFLSMLISISPVSSKTSIERLQQQQQLLFVDGD